MLVQYNFLLAKIHLVQVVFIVTGPAANIAMRFSKIARAEKKKSQCSSDYDKQEGPKMVAFVHVSRGIIGEAFLVFDA